MPTLHYRQSEIACCVYLGFLAQHLLNAHFFSYIAHMEQLLCLPRLKQPAPYHLPSQHTGGLLPFSPAILSHTILSQWENITSINISLVPKTLGWCKSGGRGGGGGVFKKEKRKAKIKTYKWKKKKKKKKKAKQKDAQQQSTSKGCFLSLKPSYDTN